MMNQNSLYKSVSTMNEYNEKHHNLLFGVRRSVRYHMHRVRHYDFWHRFVVFTTLIFGTATIVAITEIGINLPTWVKCLPAIIVSILAAIDLLFDSTRKSRLHHDLAKEFINLEIELVPEHISDELLDDITKKRLRIETNEPTVLRVLDCICYNEESRASDLKVKIKIGFFQRLFANFYDIQPHKLKII